MRPFWPGTGVTHLPHPFCGWPCWCWEPSHSQTSMWPCSLDGVFASSAVSRLNYSFFLCIRIAILSLPGRGVISSLPLVSQVTHSTPRPCFSQRTVALSRVEKDTGVG